MTTRLGTLGRRGVFAAEWPTIVLLMVTYAVFGLLTWFANQLPWWLLVPLGGYVVCLHGSLTHEAVHGHPTRNARLNAALVFPNLVLWVPYLRYAHLHRVHHTDETLTDPYDDPESAFLTPWDWSGLARPVRWLLTANNTLAGRMILGPWIALVRFVSSEISLLSKGDARVVSAWIWHLPAVVVVLIWTHAVCQVSLVDYILLFAWPGTSLTLLRSYAEHRAHEDPLGRTAVVEAHPLMSLLYLNNNLHAPHHARPALPWYELPAEYRDNRQTYLERNRGYLVRGYSTFLRKYLLRPHQPVPHPHIAGKS
ncbi:MAG: fatty acid desaturase [Pseudomonadota bacterium]